MVNSTNNENQSCQRSCCCATSNRVLCFLVLVFVFAVGVILGAAFYSMILPVLASVIAFAAAVLVVIVALLICRRRRNT